MDASRFVFIDFPRTLSHIGWMQSLSCPQSVHRRNNLKIMHSNFDRLAARSGKWWLMIKSDTFILNDSSDKRSCEIYIRYTLYTCGHYWYRSQRHGIYPNGTHAHTHARMHAESTGKQLNWSDYPLVHKEIATSISWCTYVTIKPVCTWLKWGWVCVRDISLSMELMRDGDWVLR